MALALPHIAFPDVFNGPHRSHVGVMKALGYVLGVRQIKAGAWPDMIDVPFAASSAVISPRHSLGPLRFDVGDKCGVIHAQHLRSALGLVLSFYYLVHSLSQDVPHPRLHIVPVVIHLIRSDSHELLNRHRRPAVVVFVSLLNGRSEKRQVRRLACARFLGFFLAQLLLFLPRRNFRPVNRANLVSVMLAVFQTPRLPLPALD